MLVDDWMTMQQKHGTQVGQVKKMHKRNAASNERRWKNLCPTCPRS